MPFLRVVRDKRGYETTYLLHWFREGGRQHSRILYVFRTPGGVRVGRNALDPEVLRQIEREHPDIDFDWAVVRDNQQVVEPALEPRRRRPRREEADAPAPEPTPPPAAAETPAQPQPAAAPPVRTPIPSTIEGATPDEQIAFLAHWYPIIRDRIPARTSDPARVEALTALAERLNPGAWTDADQITTGLQHASEALERLSRVYARRRRRSRRPSGEPPAGGPPDSQPPAD